MLLFGHAGITLGAATLLGGAAKSRDNRTSWFTLLSHYLDIRLLLVGSFLPDTIDKPIGEYIFKGTFNSGRIFSHTLLFFILLSAIGFYLYKRYRHAWMLPLAAGVFTHLLFDEMWLAPRTLFWPLLGFAFEEGISDWLSNIFRELLSNPAVYIPEAVGLAIMLWFSMALVKRKRVGTFIKYGKVS